VVVTSQTLLLNNVFPVFQPRVVCVLRLLMGDVQSKWQCFVLYVELRAAQFQALRAVCIAKLIGSHLLFSSAELSTTQRYCDAKRRKVRRKMQIEIILWCVLKLLAIPHFA